MKKKHINFYLKFVMNVQKNRVHGVQNRVHGDQKNRHEDQGGTRVWNSTTLIFGFSVPYIFLRLARTNFAVNSN